MTEHSSRHVDISIDEIVLRGIAVDDVAEFRAALIETLTGLARAHPWPAAPTSTGDVRAPALALPPGASAQDQGSALARSLWTVVAGGGAR